MFTAKEIEYLSGRRLGRLATLTATGGPHLVPTLYLLDPDGTLAIGAGDLPGRGQQRGYRDNIERTPRVAYVVDDVASIDPYVPRGVSIRGRAEIEPTGGERLGPGLGPVWVRITPTWVASWGIDGGPYDPPLIRTAAAGTPG
jgi:pyridoxamine 5'-phosphate oxidase family protein